MAPVYLIDVYRAAAVIRITSEGDALSAPLIGLRTKPDQPQAQAGDLPG